MAIRNTNFGGTNWTAGELGLSSTDLNDTFDAAFDYIKSISSFYLNSDLYTTYEDWESYTVGSFTTTSDWTVTLGTLSSCSIISGKHLHLTGGSTGSTYTAFSGSIESETLAINKHTYVPTLVNSIIENGSCTLQCTFGGQTPFSVHTHSGGGNSGSQSITAYIDIFVVAKGSGVYDVYRGGQKVLSDVSESDPQLKFSVAGNTGDRGSFVSITLYDILQSANTVS